MNAAAAYNHSDATPAAANTNTNNPFLRRAMDSALQPSAAAAAAAAAAAVAASPLARLVEPRVDDSSFSAPPQDNLAPQFNFAIWFLVSLAAGFLALRLYCKIHRHRDLWWDDHVLVAATLSLLASAIVATISTTYGYGQHSHYIPAENKPDLVLTNTVTGFFSLLASMWSKTSFGLTLVRISGGRVRRLVWFCIASLNLVLGSLVVLLWMQCVPLRKMWDWDVAGECLPKELMTNYNIFVSVFSAAMDLTLALLPWTILRTLTMNKKEKTAVTLAMSMGIFAGAASIVKVTKVYSTESPDLFDGVDFELWGMTEAAVTVMAASIPILRGLIGQAPRRRPVLETRQSFGSTAELHTNTNGEERGERGEKAGGADGRESAM